MNLSTLSIRRPIFVSCLGLVMIAVGLYSMKNIGVDLFPDITFPVVTVNVPYPGAGPGEVETLLSKPLEEELSTISGLKRLSSVSKEGMSSVVAEFTLETDIKYAEQQIRDRVGSSKSRLPTDIKEPVIRRIDPSDQPIIMAALNADLTPGQIFDLADQTIKPKIEQVDHVGLVEILGGRKREVQVQLDRKKLKDYEMSATQVAARLGASGQNTPVGKVDEGSKETVFRTLGEFNDPKDIPPTLLNLYGNDVPVTLGQLGQVVDTLEDEKSRTYVNGKPALILQIFRQSGSNTVAVTAAVRARLDKLNHEITDFPGKPKISLVMDNSVFIQNNIDDVRESITFGILLAIVVVYFFLGSLRSTVITGVALPNSLIGAFILMSVAGFTMNVMTLLALSLSVGLLIDDAIVVRENIFRHMEMGKPPLIAAQEGTQEVLLAVIATTMAVLSVFGPIGFLKGVTGQFFRQFGLTICFAMMISLFDALTMAPMLSAYLGGHGAPSKSLLGRMNAAILGGFDRFQTHLENAYEHVLKFAVRRPLVVLVLSFLIFVASCSTVKFVPKTFIPAQDFGEFLVAIDMPPGTNIDKMTEVAQKVDAVIHKNIEVLQTSLTVGNRDGEPNEAEFYVKLVPTKKRSVNTIQFKQRLRGQLAEFAFANPKVKDVDAVGINMRPFTMNITGTDSEVLEAYSLKLLDRLKKMPGFKEPDVNFRPGKPEFQVRIDKQRAQQLGISTIALGQELRTQVEGITPAKLRQNGLEYDIRVRLREDQRNLKDNFEKAFVPNINGSLIRLADVAHSKETLGPSNITRQDRNRYVQVSADLAPGAGLGDLMNEVTEIIAKEVTLPTGVRYSFVGQAENFQELAQSIVTVMGFAILFTFLVLASLYESFVTPFTIMLALPLAFCGAIVALAVSQKSLDIFSMIGIVMLLGVATKNSILLVDYASQLVRGGMSRADALIKAGRTRLRPILMTTMALIAGMIPVALGLNEASRQRTSMGVAIIGGLISSTLLTLIVVPAAFSYVDRFRVWSAALLKRVFTVQSPASVWTKAPRKLNLAPSMAHPTREALEAAVSKAEKPVAIFDLDGTIFDVTYRTHEILRRFCAQAEIRSRFPEQTSTAAKLRRADHAYSLEATLNNIGLGRDSEHTAHFIHLAETFWFKHFFTGDLVAFDVPYAGALGCVKKLHAMGAEIVYLSGRDVPNMSQGTIAALEKHGFPAHGHGVSLFLKAAYGLDDLLFKKNALEQIRTEGTVVATFDNEPMNVQLFLDAFPGALHFHLDTEFARALPLKGTGLHVIKDFAQIGY